MLSSWTGYIRPSVSQVAGLYATPDSSSSTAFSVESMSLRASFNDDAHGLRSSRRRNSWQTCEVPSNKSGALVTHDPLPTVSADQRQLVQLFESLVDNGIKFQPASGAPREQISAAERDRADRRARRPRPCDFRCATTG